jgi:hypothetical protein
MTGYLHITTNAFLMEPIMIQAMMIRLTAIWALAAPTFQRDGPDPARCFVSVTFDDTETPKSNAFGGGRVRSHRPGAGSQKVSSTEHVREPSENTNVEIGKSCSTAQINATCGEFL